MSKNKLVVKVFVEDGIVSDVEVPPGVKVLVYDMDGLEDESDSVDPDVYEG